MEEIYLFGGQAPNLAKLLSKSRQTPDNSAARQFLERSIAIIKSEIQLTGTEARIRFELDDVQGLLDQLSQRKLDDSAVKFALTCASQIARFISTFETRTPSYPEDNRDIRIVGESIGLFAAVAVSVASSLESLLLLGSEAVRIAFRYGAYTKEKSSSIDPGQGRTFSADDVGKIVSSQAREAFDSKVSRFGVHPKLNSKPFEEKNAIDLMRHAVEEIMRQPQEAINELTEPVAAAPRKWLSTSVQSITSEVVDFDAQTATVVAESDFIDPKLFAVIAGHVINGQGFCPSTLYADVCYTMAKYGYNLVRPDESVFIDIGALDCPAPMLVDIQESKSYIFKAVCEVNVPLKQASFKLTSFNGKKDVLHVKCTARFEDPTIWTEEWSRSAYMVQSRASQLEQKVEEGDADQITRTMAYRLFSVLVNYSDVYQGMESIQFDGQEFEAYSTVHFKAGANDGTFMMNPYYIDNLCQLTGFTVNATVDGDKECYINHGWRSLRVLEEIDANRTYYAYVKMQPVEGSKMREGDLWMFNDKKEVIGLAKGIRFQCVPKKLMNVLVPPPKKRKD